MGAGKGANSCEALYRKHTSFLSLPTKFQFEVTFLAMMRDQRASDNPVRTTTIHSALYTCHLAGSLDLASHKLPGKLLLQD